MSEIGRARAVMVEGTVTLGLRCARLRDDAALGRAAHGARRTARGAHRFTSGNGAADMFLMLRARRLMCTHCVRRREIERRSRFGWISGIAGFERVGRAVERRPRMHAAARRSHMPAR
ncbi:hypothetical protein [Burkholderia sp. MSMB617WGS]|uniref:hypothetical protein n=1 Tax=Burkholderia sp. MSMB617WGS TaxID=1637831 RepID=UPI0011AE8606|nr:hypothetical protein [Burkholderia sp. MSMB617WGS]